MEMTLDWNNFNAIKDIAFNHKINELMAKLMTFIVFNFNDFVKKDIKELCEFNDLLISELLAKTLKTRKNPKQEV